MASLLLSTLHCSCSRPIRGRYVQEQVDKPIELMFQIRLPRQVMNGIARVIIQCPLQCDKSDHSAPTWVHIWTSGVDYDFEHLTDSRLRPGSQWIDLPRVKEYIKFEFEGVYTQDTKQAVERFDIIEVKSSSKPTFSAIAEYSHIVVPPVKEDISADIQSRTADKTETAYGILTPPIPKDSWCTPDAFLRTPISGASESTIAGVNNSPGVILVGAVSPAMLGSPEMDRTRRRDILSFISEETKRIMEKQEFGTLTVSSGPPDAVCPNPPESSSISVPHYIPESPLTTADISNKTEVELDEQHEYHSTIVHEECVPVVEPKVDRVQEQLKVFLQAIAVQYRRRFPTEPKPKKPAKGVVVVLPGEIPRVVVRTGGGCGGKKEMIMPIEKVGTVSYGMNPYDKVPQLNTRIVAVAFGDNITVPDGVEGANDTVVTTGIEYVDELYFDRGVTARLFVVMLSKICSGLKDRGLLVANCVRPQSLGKVLWEWMKQVGERTNL